MVAETGAQNIVVVGDSVGGGLALTPAHAVRDAGEAAPAALILFSPWLDAGFTGADERAIAWRRRYPGLIHVWPTAPCHEGPTNYSPHSLHMLSINPWITSDYWTVFYQDLS
jgi:alpha-beta hydrolase superfamily lysophospholipase